MSALRQMVARNPGEPHRAATQLELFFDRVDRDADWHGGPMVARGSPFA